MSDVKVEVTGVDQGELWRKGLKAARDAYRRDEPLARERAHKAAVQAAYGLADTIYFLVTKLNSKEGQADRYRGEAISGLPHPSMQLVAEGTSPDDVLFEARHSLIGVFWTSGTEKTWEECRNRAARAHLTIADVQGM